jgi:hypothetical protein
MMGKTEGKRPHRRPRHKWAVDINIYVMDIGWEGMGWNVLARDRSKWCAVLNMVMNIWVL